MDSSAPLPEFRPELVQPVEAFTFPLYNAETAARMAYQDRNSYAWALQGVIERAQNNPDFYDTESNPTWDATVFGTDVEVMREVMKKTLRQLKDSDSVKEITVHGHLPDSEQDFARLYRAYDRSFRSGMEKVSMTDRQRARINFAAISELAYGVRELTARAALYGNDMDPREHVLFLDPSLQKIDYLETPKILQVFRNSGSLASKDRLQADLAVARASQRAEARAALEAFQAESEILSV